MLLQYFDGTVVVMRKFTATSRSEWLSECCGRAGRYGFAIYERTSSGKLGGDPNGGQWRRNGDVSCGDYIYPQRQWESYWIYGAYWEAYAL